MSDSLPYTDAEIEALKPDFDSIPKRYSIEIVERLKATIRAEQAKLRELKEATVDLRKDLVQSILWDARFSDHPAIQTRSARWLAAMGIDTNNPERTEP